MSAIFEPLEDVASETSNDDIATAALSILMTYPDAYDAVGDALSPSLFVNPIHRHLFVLIRREIAAGKHPDIFALAEASEGRWSVQNLHAIATLHDHSPKGLNRLVEILGESHKSRELHRIAQKMQEAAFDKSRPAQERIDAAMGELQKLEVAAGAGDDFVDAETAAMEHMALLDQREDGGCGGIETGLTDFDELLDGGMQRGNLVIVGARPSMGKTALAMTVGLHVAQRHTVAMLSMEMPHSDLRDRQLSILGRIPLSHLKRPKHHGLDYGKVVDAAEKSRHLRFFASDKTSLNILKIRAKARQMKRKNGLDLLIVDYIGLTDGLDTKQSRAYQIEEVSRGLKALAKELDIVVMCLAQVNRGATDRINTVPGLHDLRDSGAIEQDADVVALIHRPCIAAPDGGHHENYALVRVAKNRQGRTGDVHSFYDGPCTRFCSWEGAPPTQQPAKYAPRKKGFDDAAF